MVPFCGIFEHYRHKTQPRYINAYYSHTVGGVVLYCGHNTRSGVVVQLEGAEVGKGMGDCRKPVEPVDINSASAILLF
jgi:hypothetical protein